MAGSRAPKVAAGGERVYTPAPVFRSARPLLKHRDILLRALAVLACAALVGCWLPSAARRSARIAGQGFDRDRFGNYVYLTGPGGVIAATVDLAFHVIVPIDYDGYFLVDRREPDDKWFRAYDGPMLPLERVAIVCKGEQGIHIRTIRRLSEPQPTEARYEKWHFPKCIEALPGTYELTVAFFARKTYDRDASTVTYNVESTAPAVVGWNAVAGRAYVMSALLGKKKPAPGTAPPGSTVRTVRASKTKLGTSTFMLDVAKWTVRIDPVSSWDNLATPALEHRARWEQYERRR